MTTTTPAVRLTGVTKRFGKVPAVRDLDLTIEPGQTVALLGPNGAGKSTTINIMLGLVPPDAGSASLFGGSPAKAIEAGRVGAMLQDQIFLPNATVRNFIDLARGLYPNAPSTESIMETAGLAHVARTKLDKLSGGEAKRARFAFALAGDPDLLVLDEPTAAMDVAGRQGFWAAMRRYAERGKATIFATHYLDEADDFADRVIVVAHGRLIADGTAAEIKRLASGRTVAFDLAGATADGLARLPGVRSVEVLGDRVRIGTDDSDLVVTELVRSGRPFADLEVTSAGLEEAFLALTADPADPELTSSPAVPALATLGSEH
ncbi:MAG TPA: ABC transporter ATP-binding protein [Micromonosporaceae bacterium]|nr:ABC transporter ATP-binding protein [Micromonosporaceae bacterium]